MGRRRIAAATMCVLAASAVAAITAGAAKDDFGSSYADCWFSPKSGKLTVRTKNSEEAEIRRRGKKVVVLALDEARCRGGRATVGNTRRIKFLVRGDGITEGHISLEGGRLGPGRGAEPGTPEIEIVAKVAPVAALHLDGTTGGDLVRGGSVGRVQAINLNPAAEPTAPDADLTLAGPGGGFAFFNPGRGNDTIDLRGGPEFQGAMGILTTALLGPGADTFYGSVGDDFVLAEAGLDSVATGAGSDAVNTQDGLAETVDCGEGADRVQPDPIDVQVGCEEVGFVGFAP